MKSQFTIEQITQAGHDEDDAPMILALCEHLECEPSNLSRERHECYGMAVFSLGQQEYAIGTDAQADDAWEQSLDSYISECIEPEMKKKKFKQGHSLHTSNLMRKCGNVTPEWTGAGIRCPHTMGTNTT